MKIAIYGDSYGGINTQWEGTITDPKLGPSWIDIVNEQHEVTVFAKTGSAFMFSYDIFRRENKNFDLNIFIATHPHRLHIKELEHLLFFGVDWTDHNIKKINSLPFYEKKHDHLQILQSVRTYQLLWEDRERTTHIQHVLVNNLWNINPNTIVIPVADDSIEQTTTNLNAIARVELELADPQGFRTFNLNNMSCLRKCHFSDENNIVFANKVLDAISNNDKIIEFHVTDAVRPAQNSINYYVKAI